jgi:hypothetical protein
MFKRISLIALALTLALVMVVAPAGAKKKADKPAKAYWYATTKKYFESDFALHVSVDKANRIDYIRADGGCTFYKSIYYPAGIIPLKVSKKNKIKVDTTVTQYSPKDKVQTTIIVKIDGKFKDGKWKGTYTLSDPSSECTAAQKAKHKFTAKKRAKQVGG